MAAIQLTANNSIPYIVPLIPQNQTFTISLNGTTYTLTVKWNSYSNCWVLYIADDVGNSLLSGIPLVTGADLLEQFSYIGIGGALVVQSSNDPNAVPTYEDLGTVGNLYFLTPIAASS